MTQIDRIEHFTKQFHKVLDSYGAASPATNTAFFLVQAAVMGMDESTMFDWADAECARLKDITLDQLPSMFSADLENSELALEKKELEEEELKTFQEELEEQEHNVELAIKDLLKLTHAESAGWLIDLKGSKKIAFSANVEEQCPCC
jgi:hypothetical protein